MAEKEYIERASIYSEVKRHTNPYGKPTLDYESGVKVLEMIKREPAADVVEVVHGEWVQNPYCKRIFYCSECGRTVEDGSYNPNPSEHFPYCHCGAKMYKENLDG